MVGRFGVWILGVAVTLACLQAAAAAPPAAAPAAHAAPPAAPAPPPAARPAGANAGSDTGNASARDAGPLVSQDAAARARMHECGHQWSSIKKAGNAGTMTWKEFSATCLVVSK